MLERPEQPIVCTHWGTYRAEMMHGRVRALHPIEIDPDPSWLSGSMIEALDAPARILRPAVRASFLAAREAGRINTDGAGRGYEPFIELPWDEALDLAAGEIRRVRAEHGNGAIYGGSYGWASAGRFHHAQSQVHRFLNAVGGYVRSVQNYSFAAADMMVPHVLGDTRGLTSGHTSWPRMARYTQTLVMFGGVTRRNAQVGSGGIARHIVEENLEAMRVRGVRLVSVSPVRDDAEGDGVEWLAIRPGTDTALMLGLAHVLLVEGLADRAFLERYTVGFERFEPYLTGAQDGCPKSADWAAAITGIPASTIRDLARDLARSRTMLMLAWSLQRADHGEQPCWMIIALAAMLGQIGLPGGGFGIGYGSVNGVGNPTPQFSFPALSQLVNEVADFIPVARIADALLHPGEAYQFNGMDRTYPDLRLIYWAGGNPFHHHQDLNRLRRAWQRPEAVIVHDSWWNPLARHADIVFPVATQLERNDIASSSRDRFIAASHAVAEPPEGVREDYAVFCALAERLGAEQVFSEGRDVEGWLRHLYALARQKAAAEDIDLPDFEAMWREGPVLLDIPPAENQPDLLGDFRADPQGARLRTPSGKIEIWSETVAGFGYEDCPGHPVWLAPHEWLGAAQAARFPLHLLSSQPRHRLHSQYDFGDVAQKAKRNGRELLRLHPRDAAVRGIVEGAPVRIFNDRGSCLAVATLYEGLVPGVVQMPTGAWFDPQDEDASRPERQGNPNVLTQDRGTSKLAQGPSAQSCLVEIVPFDEALPDITAFTPPHLLRR